MLLFYSLLLSSLEMSDTTIYEPYIRALLGTAPRFSYALVLKSRSVPLGTALSLGIFRVSRRGAQAVYKSGAAVTPLGGDVGGTSRKVDVRLPGKGNSKCREAGPLHHHEDLVDSDQWVLNKELSPSGGHLGAWAWSSSCAAGHLLLLLFNSRA